MIYGGFFILGLKNGLKNEYQIQLFIVFCRILGHLTISIIFSSNSFFMYKEAIKNYKSPEYLKIVESLKEGKTGLTGNRLLLSVLRHPKTPSTNEMENRIKDLYDKGSIDEAVTLAMELDEYLLAMDENPKFLHIEIIAEVIHADNLIELKFVERMNTQFQCLYNDPKYLFDKDAEDVISRSFDYYIFNSNLPESLDKIKKLFADNEYFDSISLERLNNYLNNYLQMKETMENGEDNLTNHIKKLDKVSKIEFITNDFYDASEENITNHLSFVDSKIPKKVPFSILHEQISDTIKEKNNRIASFVFQYLPNMLMAKKNGNLTKSKVYRDLFPFFQITHSECMSEELWDKHRGDFTNQSYKDYQRDKVRSILGL
jgi:hypothetical protein